MTCNQLLITISICYRSYAEGNTIGLIMISRPTSGIYRYTPGPYFRHTVGEKSVTTAMLANMIVWNKI